MKLTEVYKQYHKAGGKTSFDMDGLTDVEALMIIYRVTNGSAMEKEVSEYPHCYHASHRRRHYTGNERMSHRFNALHKSDDNNSATVFKSLLKKP